MLRVDPCSEPVEVNSLHESEVELHDLATYLSPQFSTSTRFDVLLVGDAPVEVLESSHGFVPTLLSVLER